MDEYNKALINSFTIKKLLENHSNRFENDWLKSAFESFLKMTHNDVRE